MRIFLCFYFSALSFCFAQVYTFPINPKQTAYLTGNMGEIRAGHFHMGLDILAQTGTPIYASGDGYVSKIRVSSYGYGKIIHVTHPATKQQTVYAHLQGFSPAIATLVRNKQYAEEKFEIEILPTPNQLPVKRGEVIAYVGNTGASQGSHLHYEIRTLDDVVLNPAEFGFKELPQDYTPPIVQRIALLPLDSKSMLNNQWGKIEFLPARISAGQYQIVQNIVAFGEIGLEVLAHDLMDNAKNTYGFNRLEMYVNQKKTFGFQLNKIPHSHAKCMNVHVDYEVMRQRNQGFQKCYFTEGNPLKPNYDLKAGKGNIRIKDGVVYDIEVYFFDVAGNKTTLKLKIIGKKSAKPIFVGSKQKFKKPTLKYRFQENLLVLEAYHVPQGGDDIMLSFNGILQAVPLVSMQAGKAVYIWDMRKGLPDFAQLGALRKGFHFRKTILPKPNTQFKTKSMKIDFARNPLYDTLYLELSAWQERLSVGNPYLPLHESIVVGYTFPQAPAQKSKTGAYYLGYDYQDSWWEGNTIFFRTRYFGNFHMRPDTEPPKVKLLRKSPQQVVLQVKDNLAGFAEHKAWLNGKFILLDFEYKGSYLTTEALPAQMVLAGKLEVWIKDKAGNEARQVFAL